jgi:mannose-6-phosphate isomerase-like protein (cupin superfamily)
MVIRMAKDAHVVRAMDAHSSKLDGGATFALLDGAEFGFGAVSIVIAEYPPNADAGGADRPHRHPHISAIVITEGQGRFTIGDETVDAAAGDVVVVPANAWHSFVNTGNGALRFVSVEDTDRHAAEVAP